MGYNLTIGEAVPVIDLEERTARIDVHDIGGDEAEALGSPPSSASLTVNVYGNSISPSYIDWHAFCVQVDLFAEFFAPDCPLCGQRHPRGCDICRGELLPLRDDEGGEDNGLLYGYGPCSNAILPLHLERFLAARARWVEGPAAQHRLAAGEIDINLRRLDWLIFWTRWSLENCKYPTLNAG